MFQLATSRMASNAELSVLLELYESELQRFREQPNAAKAFLKYGALETAEVTDQKMLAAHSYVASTIFNLDETIRK